MMDLSTGEAHHHGMLRMSRFCIILITAWMSTCIDPSACRTTALFTSRGEDPTSFSL